MSRNNEAQAMSYEPPIPTSYNRSPKETLTGTRPHSPQPHAQATARTPEWRYWRRVQGAAAWKLAALSLNIEPSSVLPQHENTFPNEAVFGRFTLITAAIKKRFAVQDQQLVKYAEFLGWAVTVSLEMPFELQELAQSAPDRER
jgi:hypothetical protein